jgi:hypothetical protein
MCPHSHVFQVLRLWIRERRLKSSARQGVLIFLLGLLCPFFWIAYFSGASRAELIFHAAHSGIFMLIGLLLVLYAIAKSDA